MKIPKNFLIFFLIAPIVGLVSCSPNQKTKRPAGRALTGQHKCLTKLQQTFDPISADYHDELQLLNTKLTQEEFQEHLHLYITKKHTGKWPFYTYHKNLRHILKKLTRNTKILKKLETAVLQQAHTHLIIQLEEIKKIVENDKQYLIEKRKKRFIKAAIAIPASLIGTIALGTGVIFLGIITGYIGIMPLPAR